MAGDVAQTSTCTIDRLVINISRAARIVRVGRGGSGGYAVVFACNRSYRCEPGLGGHGMRRRLLCTRMDVQERVGVSGVVVSVPWPQKCLRVARVCEYIRKNKTHTRGREYMFTS